MIQTLWLVSLMLAMGTAAPTQAAPQKTVTPAEAESHILQRVAPTIPPLAKAARIGGKVKLHIIVSPTGEVSSVNVVNGHPMLVPAAVEAVRKWRYKPFTDKNVAVAVAADVEMDFPGGMSESESAVRNKFFPMENQCRSLINKGHYLDAEMKCRQAVELSNQLPKEVVLERSSARALLANSLFLQRRVTEAIPIYEEALQLDKGCLKPNDADLATDYQNLGRAYGVIGALTKADTLYAPSISTFEAAIDNLPDMRENYTRRLKRALNEYAQLKDAQGQSGAAEELRRKAATLP